MNWLYCTADQFIDQFLPLFERISHCELILANRPDVDQCSVLARMQAAKFEIERLSSKKRIEEIEEIETEEVEETDQPEIDPATVALAALIPEPLPNLREGYTHAKRTPSGNRWLNRAKAFLQENGPATASIIAVGLGVQTETDKRLLNASLHTAYKKNWIFQAGTQPSTKGRANVIWTVAK